MGCDVHVHVEVKIDGQWHHYNHPYVERNYHLFCMMAGVRQYEDSPTPIAQPRGLPKDITFMTRYDAEVKWGSDGHSHSWLSADETQKIIDWYESQHPERIHPQLFGYVFGNSFGCVYKYPGDCRHLKGFTDVRIVFWFDN